MTSKSSCLSSSIGTNELCHGKDEVQSKVSLLLPQEGVKLEGKCPPCISRASVKRPHEEKATHKHQPIAISSLTQMYML